MLIAESMLKSMPGSNTIPSALQAMSESSVALGAICRTWVGVEVLKATSVVFGEGVFIVTER